MWPSIIGAAGSLLGGIVNRNSAKKAANQERKWAVEDQAEQFVRLRSAAEKGGFNPLAVLGAVPNSGMVGQTQAAQSYMGTAIADSALMLADSMAKTNAAATGKKLQNANRANAALSAKLTAATLRPKMAGVFDRASKFGIGANSSADVRRPDAGGTNGKPNADHPLVDSFGDIAVADPTMDRGAGFYAFGQYVEPPPGFSNPAYMENNEMGDSPLSWPYTATYMAAMAGHNLRRFTNYWERQRIEKNGGFTFKSGGKIFALMPEAPNRENPQGFRAQHLGAK